MRCIIGRDHREFILRRIKPGSRVLEWGSGGSTLWLAEHLPAGAHLTSIEHHDGWYQTVVTQIGKRAHVRLICAPPAEGDGGGNATIGEEDPTHLERYIHAVDGEQFDVVIVDGVARGACMEHARSLLAPDGVLFLHDAQRDWYDAAKGLYVEYGVVGSCADYPGPMLWYGGNTPPTTRCGASSSPMVISYYTIDTPYEEEVKHLRGSCEALGVDHYIEGVRSCGSWEQNCALKASFVKACSERFTRPVLWVDADAVLRESPVLLGGAEMDFAIWKALGWQFASGTVYFNRTEHAQRVLDGWIEECAREPMVWDQIHLDTAWERVTARHALRTMWLPPSYTKIFDLESDAKYGSCLPVIEHFQASRRFKDVISGNTHAGRQMREPSEELKAARHAGRARSCWYDEQYGLAAADPEADLWGQAVAVTDQ